MKKPLIFIWCFLSVLNLSLCLYNRFCVNAFLKNKPVVETEQNIKNTICEKSGFFVEDPINPLEDMYMKNITSYQGLRDKIRFNAGGETSSYHDALDIECPDFTPVKAVKSGKIIECWPSYYNGGAKYKGHPTYGGYIEIQHEDGTRSGYAHLSLTSVKEGDTVKQGEIIGRSGGVSGRRGSGLSTGPHLHFFIRFNMNSFYSIK